MIYVTLKKEDGEQLEQRVHINSLDEARDYCDMMDFLGYEIVGIEIKEPENVGVCKKTRGHRSILRTFLSRCLYQG